MNDYLALEKAAELEGVSYAALVKRCERKNIVLANDPGDARRKLYPASALSLAAHRKWKDTRVQACLQPRAPENSRPQGLLPFAIPEPSSSSIAPPPVPENQRAFVETWLRIIGDCHNGTWRKYRGHTIAGVTVNSRRDYIRAAASEEDIGASTIYQKLQLRREIDADSSIPIEQRENEFIKRILPAAHPGRSAYSFFADPDNFWMREKLSSLYLTQAKLSVKRAWELLLLEIDAKQRAWGIGHLYQKPTLRQCRTYLSTVSLPQKVLAREGEKAYSDRCAPYISRDPDSIRSNDIWTTDQKQIDVRLRGAGEQLGRIWMVTFEDVRSSKVMGYFFGPVLSSDMVISAAHMAISRYGVPRAIQMDLGKEFQCTAFSGRFQKIKGETLLRETQGLCQRLGIDTIDAIGRNPQTKPIERWHDVISEFDKNIPGWCGRNTDERPEVLAEFEQQHAEWKTGKRASSPLWTIRQYVYAAVDWIENEWNAMHRGRGKYLQGATPDECWRTHLPANGTRSVTAQELDLASSDHRVLKVARGGQINITFYGQTIEYQAPELFLRQGQELEVIISRRTLSRITVLDKASGGRLLCEATTKPLYHWLPENRDELREAMRCKNAVKKAVKRGDAARNVLEVTANPVQIAEVQHPIREISSMEFRSRSFRKIIAPKTLTAGELARRAQQLQGEQ